MSCLFLGRASQACWLLELYVCNGRRSQLIIMVSSFWYAISFSLLSTRQAFSVSSRFLWGLRLCFHHLDSGCLLCGESTMLISHFCCRGDRHQAVISFCYFKSPWTVFVFFEGLGFQAFFLFVWSVLCDLWFISYFDWLWASFFMVRFWFSCSGTRYNFRFWPQYAICFWLICNFCMGFGFIGYRLEGRRSQQEDQTHCTKEWECVPEASCEGTFKIFKIKSFTRLPNVRRW